MSKNAPNYLPARNETNGRTRHRGVIRLQCADRGEGFFGEPARRSRTITADDLRRGRTGRRLQVVGVPGFAQWVQRQRPQACRGATSGRGTRIQTQPGGAVAGFATHVHRRSGRQRPAQHLVHRPFGVGENRADRPRVELVPRRRSADRNRCVRAGCVRRCRRRWPDVSGDVATDGPTHEHGSIGADSGGVGPRTRSAHRGRGDRRRLRRSHEGRRAPSRSRAPPDRASRWHRSGSRVTHSGLSRCHAAPRTWRPHPP